MSSISVLTSLLRYKQEADRELLEALEVCRDTAPSPVFAAALRVFNHAHIVDRIFAAHLSGTRHDYAASWTSDPPPLVQLSAAIRETDAWYVNYIAGITPETLEQSVRFRFTDGGQGHMTREEMIAHVITHAGYHRGEIGRLLPDIEATAMRDVFAGFLHRSEPERRARYGQG